MKFPYPFQGKHSPLNLSGLFLLDPSVHMKLHGVTMRSALEELWGEALFKRFDRAVKVDAVSPALLEVLLNELPEKVHPVLETLRAACSGDAEAMAKANAAGPWETFSSGIGERNGYCLRYRVALERACYPSLVALRAGQFGEAVSHLQAESLTKALLWPDACAALDGATATQHLGTLQFAVCMEVELSCLAAVDASQPADHDDTANVTVLLADLGVPLNPAALFFRWIMRMVGAVSLGELERKLEEVGRPIHRTTLKNWHRGAQVPSETWLKLIVTLCPQLARQERIWRLLAATRTLMLLGHFSAVCVRVASAAHEHTAARAHSRPWPSFPHGYADFGAWARCRYPVWLAYHRTRFAASAD